MKFPFLPNNGAYSDLFEAAGNNLAEAARLLLDLITDFVDPEMKAKRLVDCEHEGDRITDAVYSRLNSTFVTPIDREDIAASLVHLRDISREPLQSWWNRINELESEGDRVYRRALADLYAFSDDDDSLARHVLTWKDIVDELERAMDGLEHVADAVESIVLKNA